jgi:hypothetical protein
MTTLNLVITDKLDDGMAVDVTGVTQILDDASSSNICMNDVTLGIIGLPAVTYPFWRFVSVTIPQGATINTATLGLTQETAAATNPTDANIYGNDVDNAAQPTTYADIVSMTQTTATTLADVSSAATKAYDVTSIVQEIVNRGGWTSGNALLLAMFPDTGVADNLSDTWYTYDGGTAPTLDIDYTVGGPSGDNNFWVSM